MPKKSDAPKAKLEIPKGFRKKVMFAPISDFHGNVSLDFNNLKDNAADARVDSDGPVVKVLVVYQPPKKRKRRVQ